MESASQSVLVKRRMAKSMQILPLISLKDIAYQRNISAWRQNVFIKIITWSIISFGTSTAIWTNSLLVWVSEVSANENICNFELF